VTGQSQRDPASLASEVVATYRADPDWLDRFADELDRQRGAADLDRFLRAWGLSRAEAGTLFGVSRQAFTKWLTDGVPVERAAMVADIGRATDLLIRHIKHDRIAAVVRRPAAHLDGQSLLDLVAAGRSADLLTAVRTMFQFTDVHA
jgi:hypothetical protein